MPASACCDSLRHCHTSEPAGILPMMGLHVAGLWRYPVKSLAGEPLSTAELGPDGMPARQDERITTSDEPSHDDLCEREQRFLLAAIDGNVDLTDHMADAIKSLAIVLAADQSVRTGKVVSL